MYQTVSQCTGHLRSEDFAEPREPHVVQLNGPYSRARKVQTVLVTLPELDGPLPRLMKGEPRMQEVICGISQGPYRRVRARPGENADVPTLEGVGLGRPLPPRPLHVRQMGVYARVHTRRHEESHSQCPHRPEYSVHPRVSSVRGERRGGHQELPAYTVLRVHVSKHGSQLSPDCRPRMVRELSQGLYDGVATDDLDIRQS